MWIYFFDFENKTEINNTVYSDFDSAKNAGIQIGRSFDIEGIVPPITDTNRILVFKAKNIKVYVLRLDMSHFNTAYLRINSRQDFPSW